MRRFYLTLQFLQNMILHTLGTQFIERFLVIAQVYSESGIYNEQPKLRNHYSWNTLVEVDIIQAHLGFLEPIFRQSSSIVKWLLFPYLYVLVTPDIIFYHRLLSWYWQRSVPSYDRIRRFWFVSDCLGILYTNRKIEWNKNNVSYSPFPFSSLSQDYVKAIY